MNEYILHFQHLLNDLGEVSTLLESLLHPPSPGTLHRVGGRVHGGRGQRVDGRVRGDRVVVRHFRLERSICNFLVYQNFEYIRFVKVSIVVILNNQLNLEVSERCNLWTFLEV